MYVHLLHTLTTIPVSSFCAAIGVPLRTANTSHPYSVHTWIVALSYCSHKQTRNTISIYTTRRVLCPLVVGTCTCTRVWLIGKQLQFKYTHTHTHTHTTEYSPASSKAHFHFFYKGGQPSCTKFSSRFFLCWPCKITSGTIGRLWLVHNTM